MLGAVRLYLEPSEKLAADKQPQPFIPIIDTTPEHAKALRRRLERRGYIVHAFAL